VNVCPECGGGLATDPVERITSCDTCEWFNAFDWDAEADRLREEAA
jgi:hypothetical protein